MKKNKYLDQLGKKARVASEFIVKLTEEKKNKVLNDYIQEIKKNKKKTTNFFITHRCCLRFDKELLPALLRHPMRARWRQTLPAKHLLKSF